MQDHVPVSLPRCRYACRLEEHRHLPEVKKKDVDTFLISFDCRQTLNKMRQRNCKRIKWHSEGQIVRSFCHEFSFQRNK